MKNTALFFGLLFLYITRNANRSERPNNSWLTMGRPRWTSVQGAKTISQWILDNGVMPDDYLIGE